MVMAKNKKQGAIGLTIPVINPSSNTKNKMTAIEVLNWRAALPVADTGAAAKKLYLLLSELNSSILDPKQRFDILELLRHLTKTICTALKKHYVEQTEPLTEHKLTIATLRQTLLVEMADNYKIVIEELHAKPNKTEDEIRTIPAAICRALYYLNVVLLCRYQLYSGVPETVWQDVHLLYKFAKQQNLLTTQVACELSFNGSGTSPLAAYTRIILLSATDPYQWRQRDQYSINKAIDLWSIYPLIHETSKITDKKTGVYIIDLDKDYPPIAFIFKQDPITDSCIALDLSKNVKHLNQILLKMQSNELFNKIQNPNDPEFSVTAPILIKLIKIWSQQITRNAQRFPITAKINVAFGLTAAHYYINNMKEFNPRIKNSFEINDLNALPVFEIEDESDDSASTEVSATAATGITIDSHYKIYNYNIENISPNGFCIIINDGTFPPFQAGEIMIFKNPQDSQEAPWSIGNVRWIKSPKHGVFQIGIELIAPFAKAASLQMIRDNKPAGLLLRCLVLPEAPDLSSPPMIITPNMPLHSTSVMLYLDSNEGIKASLVKEVEATGTYYQYVYNTKENINVSDPLVEDPTISKVDAPEPNNAATDDNTNTEFDAIWKDL